MNSELERLFEKAPRVNLGSVAKRVTRINDLHEYGLSDVRGVSNSACVAKCREKWPMVAVGDYIQTFTRKNSDDLDLPFMGVNREKQIAPTSANTENIDRRKYSILKCGEFVFSGMQTGRDVCIRIALSEIKTDILLSPAYTTFRVDPTKPILPEYFFLNFKSSEMDRQGWFKSDSSIRSNLDWERFCEIQIPLPPIEVQRAYVDAYKGLTALIEENEALLKSLEESAQACVAKCREKWSLRKVGDFIKYVREKNTDCKITLEQGVNIKKQFITPQRSNSNLSTRVIVRKGQFAYCTQLNNENVAIALRQGEDCVVSPVYSVFEVTSSDLLPEFLLLCLMRPEFGRYVYWASVGSAYEFLTEESMQRYQIPLPPIEVQRAIVALYHCAEEARRIASEAKEQLAQVCPAMIQRASVIKRV